MAKISAAGVAADDHDRQQAESACSFYGISMQGKLTLCVQLVLGADY